MLRNSFVFLDGIGRQREVSLWRSGVRTWQDFQDEDRVKGIASERKAALDSALEDAGKRLDQRDSGYFAEKMPGRELWRCLGEFGDSVAFLDIETTGISLRSPITVIGIFDGVRMHTLVRGQNLNGAALKAMLGSVDAIVTFNGSTFDIPMVASQFPGCVPPVPHIDLRYPLRRIGLSGGLKNIERELGIERDRRVEYMTGEDAVYLWKLWEMHGKKNALDLLLEYNSEDCRNLKLLAERVYKSLRISTFETVVSP